MFALAASFRRMSCAALCTIVRENRKGHHVTGWDHYSPHSLATPTPQRAELQHLTLWTPHAGHADVDIIAEPVGAVEGDDGTVVGLSKRGMLVNLQPAEAASVYKTKTGESSNIGPPIDSHPIVMSRKSLAGFSGELPEMPKSLFTRTIESAAVRAAECRSCLRHRFPPAAHVHMRTLERMPQPPASVWLC
jgi:hypothetical protein